MFQNFSLDHYPEGVAAILFSVAAVLFIQSLIEKSLGGDTLRRAHEVGGYYMALAGTFYAVLLGLVVFDAMSKFEAAEKTVQSEAKSALTVYALATQFPDSQDVIQTLIQDYTNEVVENEWQLMAKGEVSDAARRDLVDLIRVVKSISPATQNQQAVYGTLLSEVVSLWDSRLSRNRVSTRGVPAAEWTVLLIGAAITIAFTFFFTSESYGVLVLMRGMIALLISMSLYLVLLYGAPFSGALKVSVSPFRFVAGVMANAEANRP
jgi:hypothetical protein